ncbi:hypothetical protein D3C87_483460 [compost metagenome]|uniref:hypothetical protein n=1 Tax=Pedobacter ghigonis TaxID=2730403 RepID=UPI000F9B8A97|nr:hypothetical protein [Pedobacter ghigonis]
MKGKTIFYSGIALVAVSIIMAIWGIHMFTYRGDFNNIMSITGQYSFILCGPFFLIGLALLIVGYVKI